MSRSVWIGKDRKKYENWAWKGKRQIDLWQVDYGWSPRLVQYFSIAQLNSSEIGQFVPLIFWFWHVQKHRFGAIWRNFPQRETGKTLSKKCHFSHFSCISFFPLFFRHLFSKCPPTRCCQVQSLRSWKFPLKKFTRGSSYSWLRRRKVKALTRAYSRAEEASQFKLSGRSEKQHSPLAY